MENASKAIIIAGAILIAVGLISLTMIFFSSYKDFNSKVDKMRETEDVLNFNRYFIQSAYDVNPTKPGVQVYGYDVYNLIMKGFEVLDGNAYTSNNGYFVVFEAWTNDSSPVLHSAHGDVSVQSLNEWVNYDEFEDKFKDQPGAMDKILDEYTYTYETDDKTGAVKRIIFEK